MGKDTTARLTKLRELMKKNNVDIYVVPSEDSHQTEYTAATDQRRAFISGFLGSAGTAIITADKAALATDGRYYNQAGKELDHNWELIKTGFVGMQTWRTWVAEQSKGGKTVGVDPTTVTATWARETATIIQDAGGKDLVSVPQNLVDIVWGDDRPPRSRADVFVLDLAYAGKSHHEKIADIQQDLSKRDRAGLIISALDEVAWLFNLRGADNNFSPVFFSYALVKPDSTTLYIDDSKITPSVRKHLNGVDIQPYHAIFDDLTSLAANVDTSTPKKFLVTEVCSWALVRALGGHSKVEAVRSPVAEKMAIKNETELQGMRDCHIRDGAALIKFFAWLEDMLLVKGAKIDEVMACDKLEEYRSQGQHYVSLSFETIAATGANAAVIHYKPDRGTCRDIDANAIFLCDSGGQYLDGTTDTTRTLHMTKPTEIERKAYTLVLKGHIALDACVFADRTSGYQLEALARQFLWREGLDYNHGTGHGVGSFLNVHETTTVSISPRPHHAAIPLAVGNVVSNEPGYYEDGDFGIRIENMVMVREAQTKHRFNDKAYLGFEHVTMVPMCRKLIDLSLLSPEEKKWLDDYHVEVREKTRALVEDDERALRWLERETAPL